MALTVEDARQIADMRKKLIENMNKGLVPEAGIDKSELKRILELVRSDRSIGVEAGNKKKSAAKTMIPLDLDAFMKGK